MYAARRFQRRCGTLARGKPVAVAGAAGRCVEGVKYGSGIRGRSAGLRAREFSG